MKLSSEMYPRAKGGVFAKSQTGLGLVGAVFVIVVVALLAVAMAKMLEADKLSQSFETLGLKAFLAAESGAQLGVNRLLAPDGVGACVTTTESLEANSLRFCTADISCGLMTSGGETFYTITSRGSCRAGDLIASRALEIRVRP